MMKNSKQRIQKEQKDKEIGIFSFHYDIRPYGGYEKAGYIWHAGYPVHHYIILLLYIFSFLNKNFSVIFSISILGLLFRSD